MAKPTIAAPRPRVEGDREEEILDATLELLLDVGYDRLTMDAVARRARASKATLYRRWDNKPSLVVDAHPARQAGPLDEAHDTGSLRGDLSAPSAGARHRAHDPATRRCSARCSPRSASDPEFAEPFRRGLIGPKIAVSREICERALERGEIPTDVDLDLIAPGARRDPPAPLLRAGPVPDDETVQRVIDQIILPAGATRGRPPHPQHAQKKARTHD